MCFSLDFLWFLLFFLDCLMVCSGLLVLGASSLHGFLEMIQFSTCGVDSEASWCSIGFIVI